jgi:hypothetical protein
MSPYRPLPESEACDDDVRSSPWRGYMQRSATLVAFAAAGSLLMAVTAFVWLFSFWNRAHE